MNLSHQKYDCGCASAARDRVLDLTRPEKRPQRRKKGVLRNKSPSTEPTLTKLLDRPLRRRLHEGSGQPSRPFKRRHCCKPLRIPANPPGQERSRARRSKPCSSPYWLQSSSPPVTVGARRRRAAPPRRQPRTTKLAWKLPRTARRAPKAKVPTRRSRLASKATQGLGSPGRAALVTKRRASKDKSPRASLTNRGVDSWSVRSRKDDSGTLEVLLTGPGDRIRQQTDNPGGTINLTYSENGSASSSSSSSVSSSSVNQVVSNSSSGSSSSSSSSKSSR